MDTKKITGEVIKVSPRITVAILIFVATFFLLFIYLSGKQTEKYEAADFSTEIKYTVVDGKKAWGSFRGALFYDEDKFVDKSATQIGNNPADKKFWSSHGPFIDFNSEPHQYTLADLQLPFMISKKANSDTLLVMKDGIPFMFKLYISKSDAE